VQGLLAFITYHPVQRWGPVSPHGVGTAVGFLAGAILMARRAEPRGIPRAEVYNAVTWGAVGALIGARGFYVVAHLSQFTNIKDIVAVWQGGLTMFGGFLGGLVLGLWYLHRKGFKIPPALDAAAPGFAVGVLVGRVGDLIIADHLGRHTSFPLGYRIPGPGPCSAGQLSTARLAPGYGPPYYASGCVVHHTALYDFAGTLVLLGFLYWYERRRPAVGSLFAAFAVWYGLQRFVIDFTRNRTLIESHFFGLSGSQWAGLAFAVAGAVWLIRLRRPPSAVPAPEPVPVPVIEARPELSEMPPEQVPPLPTPEEAFVAPPEPEPAPIPEPGRPLTPASEPAPAGQEQPAPAVVEPQGAVVDETQESAVTAPAPPAPEPVDADAPEAVTFEDGPEGLPEPDVQE
jgi:phosphatidylglycerol:prolipoprotein diacylglycerol transferase